MKQKTFENMWGELQCHVCQLCHNLLHFRWCIMHRVAGGDPTLCVMKSLLYYLLDLTLPHPFLLIPTPNHQ